MLTIFDEILEDDWMLGRVVLGEWIPSVLAQRGLD